MPERRDFWSRRRASVAKEESEAELARQRAKDADAQAAFEAEEDETILQALGLPDPDTLTPKDAAAFMARAVPARLRRRAMRALFRSHPGLSMPDGLQDYDDDYTVAPPDMRPTIAKWEPVIRDLGRRVETALVERADDPLSPADAEEAPPPTDMTDGPGAKDDIPDETPRPRRMVFHLPEGSA